MKRNFLKSISIVFIISIIAKVLGFVKQIVLANVFGATQSTDMFFSSYFFIIEISTAFFTALSTALLLSYGKMKKKSQDEVNNMFSKCFFVFLIFSIILFLVLFAVPGLFAKIIAPGYSDVSQFSKYIRFLSPIIILFFIQSIYNAILEYEKKFIPAKTLSFFINLFSMIFALLFAKKYGTLCLIFAVIFAFIIQTLESYIFAKKYVKMNKNILEKNDEYSKLIKSYMPLFIGSAIAELNSIVDRSIASNLTFGAVSSITYGASVNEIITVLLIGSVVSVFYPYITHDLLNDNNQKLVNNIKNIIYYMSLSLLPITIIFILFSKEIVTLLYFRGSFDISALNNTSSVVFGYALGFIPLMLRSILTKVHYAYNDSKVPMFNGAITVVFNISMSIFLSKNIGLIGIPIASSLSYVISSILYLVSIRKHIIIKLEKSDYVVIIKTIIIFIFLIFCSSILKKSIFISSTILYLIIMCLLILLIYIIMLSVFRIVNFYKLKKYMIRGKRK